ncbi:hypothetical protein SAMN05216522_10561 [Rosenbergiella nectarea]|uniref:Uncharacterized protein n=1 Tax=Rosenbergiella nectarea TaxID=988801 RepID=A0A1H9HTI1_9GAMM|nr:hypothetical protein [Rosenbergiella nectarea]SEQ65643.1 hypothetical protein SAMN05216522_10561 [Rosenbergiella nectarea]
MTINPESIATPNIETLIVSHSCLDEQSSRHLNTLLTTARQQQRHEEALADKRTRAFMVLFMFLYLMLGASLTLPTSPIDFSHTALRYAIESIPVLISFSGFFISVLFFFSTRRAYRRNLSWHTTISSLETRAGQQLSQYIEGLNCGPQNYSNTGLQSALALFVCVTWVVLYNFFTFTTSGVIGSVISLFISTMVYVMLDIQLLKASQTSVPDEHIEAP